MPYRPRLDSDLASIRLAVRKNLLAAGIDSGRVLVALSGGADSLALAAAAGFVAQKLGLAVRAIVVDHSLQPGSERVAKRAALAAAALGLAARVRRVSPSGGGGVEALARRARYAVLEEERLSWSARAVLLGHTQNDQAEGVLLGLLRGSGPVSLAGMRPINLPWLRPLLSISRAQTEAACKFLGVSPWRDPNNADSRFMRSRIRREVLPALERSLGRNLVPALARSAEILRQESQALEAVLSEQIARLSLTGDSDRLVLKVSELGRLFMLGRVVRKVVWENFGLSLSLVQTRAVENLVISWRGQGVLALSGGLKVWRRKNYLIFSAPPKPASAK